MYCVIFEPGKNPKIWEDTNNWPGLSQLFLPKNTYVHFLAAKNWIKYTELGDFGPVHVTQVPAEYRATILILT